MSTTNVMLLTTFLLAFTGTVMNRTHMMSMLLGIETMTLSLFMILTMLSTNSPNTAAMPIIMMTLAACEASTGLTLLVLTSKKNTNDYMKNLNLLQC
uniref:NADH-ubiquinone oxidoreductase chain 4L n=1 Tax=Chlamydosaurus kingii TaxID=103699 RepID=A4KVX8_CHLKI|nr:NADH dehydrogenase subunit 4L [Chlamydosaurus kingii]ABK53972.1 NADH dehydrogenase subunit 4L [Chlamydosaurus kingii]ABK53985.1 NADH dehydrogenase subunit 4L [Chlamydosaurus kingii]ABK53998.1 NADH dehydrogenase subunit 4L [Chlamydosaurus kingii]